MTSDTKGHSEDVELGESSHNDYDLTITIPKANLDKLGTAEDGGPEGRRPQG